MYPTLYLPLPEILLVNLQGCVIAEAGTARKIFEGIESRNMHVEVVLFKEQIAIGQNSRL